MADNQVQCQQNGMIWLTTTSLTGAYWDRFQNPVNSLPAKAGVKWGKERLFWPDRSGWLIMRRQEAKQHWGVKGDNCV